MSGNFLFEALKTPKVTNTIELGPRALAGGGYFNQYDFSGTGRSYYKSAADFYDKKTIGMTLTEYNAWLKQKQYLESPEGQAAEIAKQNALKAAEIQANLVLKQTQAQQAAYQMQNDTLSEDFMRLDRTAIQGLDRLKNRGYDRLGDQSGAAAALGLSMSGSVLENQNYLGQQVMNSFTDFNSGIRSQKNQISTQIDQNKFAIQTLQTSAAIQADSIKGLAKLQTYRAY